MPDSHIVLWTWIGLVTVISVGLISNDIRNRILPNSLVLAFTVVAGLRFLPPIDTSVARFTSSGRSLGFGLVCLFVAVLAYNRGLIGGGDAKASFALGLLLSCISATGWLVYLAAMIVAGLITLVWWTRSDLQTRAKGIPMGPVFLIGIGPALAVGLGLGL